VDEGRMRLIIGKKPPPEKRDNNGKVKKKPIIFSSEFPSWLLPNYYDALLVADSMPKLRITRYCAKKDTNEMMTIDIWNRGERKIHFSEYIKDAK